MLYYNLQEFENYLEVVDTSFFFIACSKKVLPNRYQRYFFLAELRRAKRAREVPWVRKNGNLSSRENLVMTSAYERESERASERRPYRLWGRRRGVSR